VRCDVRGEEHHGEQTGSRVSRRFESSFRKFIRNASRTVSSGSRCEVVYPSCLVFRVNTTNRPIRVSCRDLDAWCLGLNGEISRVDGERTRPEGKQSQHDEPTDSRLLSGSRCVVSRTVVFSILYRSITPDVILSPSFYGRDLERGEEHHGEQTGSRVSRRFRKRDKIIET
jgi:hypothetical protein